MPCNFTYIEIDKIRKYIYNQEDFTLSTTTDRTTFLLTGKKL